jgi:hypothetical protein
MSCALTHRRVDKLSEEIKALTKEIEALAEAGEVEKSNALTSKCMALKAEKDKILSGEGGMWEKERKQTVCGISLLVTFI